MQATDAKSYPKSAELFPVRRLIVDVLLAGGFASLMAWVLREHVPSEDPFWIGVWSVMTALCLAGVFFVALQMLRLVLHDKGEDEEQG